jgi:MYXO-CTERM domain-containing protein
VCAAAQNLGGATFGAVRTFTTPAAPPVVTTTAALVGAAGAATLNGTVDPRGTATTTWFRYATVDPGACDDVFGTATDRTDAGSARTASAISARVAGLAPGTYWVCALAENAAGTSFGELLTFEIVADPTPPPPSRDGGCGCRTVGGNTRTPGALTLGLAFALLAVVRRRRGLARGRRCTP